MAVVLPLLGLSGLGVQLSQFRQLAIRALTLARPPAAFADATFAARRLTYAANAANRGVGNQQQVGNQVQAPAAPRL